MDIYNNNNNNKNTMNEMNAKLEIYGAYANSDQNSGSQRTLGQNAEEEEKKSSVKWSAKNEFGNLQFWNDELLGIRNMFQFVISL